MLRLNALSGFGVGRLPFVLHIAADTANANLRTLANAAGYVGAGDATIIVDAGVDVYSTSTGTAALVPGAWPSGIVVTLVVRGTVTGCGGAGGASGYYNVVRHNGVAGGSGGTALSASGIAGFTFRVDSQGTIRSGGGGGGGGGLGAYPTGMCTGVGSGGGGGGGGQGHNGGSAGAAMPDLNGAGANGSAGSTSAAGAGGGAYISGVGGAGGAGGSWGVAGTAGSAGIDGYGVGGVSGGSGGVPGNAVTGDTNIIWINIGTRLGGIS